MMMAAVAKDPTTKAMLRLTLNVTAFVPTDTVRVNPLPTLYAYSSTTCFLT
jgi:hypothetical protein